MMLHGFIYRLYFVSPRYCFFISAEERTLFSAVFIGLFVYEIKFTRKRINLLWQNLWKKRGTWLEKQSIRLFVAISITIRV